MKYRKKPVIIEAVKVSDFISDNLCLNQPTWLNKAYEDGVVSIRVEGKSNVVIIKTLEGLMTTTGPDDYIIQGVKGEIYSCRGDIFKQTYEPAE